MKVETVVTLSEELLAALVDRAPDPAQRSKLVQVAVRAHLARLHGRDASHDLEIINAHAAALNAEAEDILSHQVIP